MIPLNPKSYLYIGGAIGALLLGMWIYSLPESYRKEGERRSDAKHAEQDRIAINNRNADIERLKLQQAETNRKVVADYENQLKSLSERLASAKRDGLRMPKTVCSGIAARAEAASTEANNAIESIRLPSDVEDGLFDIVRKADEVNLQLGACQKWIIENGFYQTYQTSTPNK